MLWNVNNLTNEEFSKIHFINSLQSFYNIPNFENLYIQRNWNYHLLIYGDKNNIISFSKLYFKKIFGFNFCYLPGGIEGKISEVILNDLYKFIKFKFGIFSIIFLKLYQNKIDKIPAQYLKIKNLHEAKMVMKKDLNELDDLKKSYSKNWRHNYNRSKNNKFYLITNNNPNFNELSSMYLEMSSIKKRNLIIRKEYIENIFKIMRNNIFHIEAYADNQIIAFRSVIYFKNASWDLFACSNSDSKKNYSTYQIMHKMFECLIKNKIKIFDFSGVDKKNNIGVYNFKKGAGGMEYKVLGELTASPIIFIKYLLLVLVFVKRLARH